MEGRRRQRWDNNRRSHNRKPPRGSWQPTVPSWEKEFCKRVGSLDWETLLVMKKFTHLYDNVINWNDSAGKEALSNAKKRFWAEINGLSCDIPLPDPNLYIDEINWDFENNQEFHNPVVILGDSFVPNHGFFANGWGENEENFKGPDTYPCVDHFNPWDNRWGDSYYNGAPSAWPEYCNNAWQFSDGYVPWGGGWNIETGWNGTDYRYFNHVGPGFEENRETGYWNSGYVDDRYVSSYRAYRVQENDQY